MDVVLAHAYLFQLFICLKVTVHGAFILCGVQNI